MGEVSGVVVQDVVAWARARGAELVDFKAPRKGRSTPRSWLAAVCAIEGRDRKDAAALTDSVLRRAGLSTLASTHLDSLPAFAHVALAMAETAAVIARDPSAHEVVVPEPPIGWPHRHEVRRAAVSLFAGARVVLHAFEAWELAPLVAPEKIVDAAGRSLGPPEGRRAIVLRVYGWGDPYTAFRAAMEEKGVRIEGGPIAHVLTAPEGVGVRDVLAAAYEVGLDVLEARDALAS